MKSKKYIKLVRCMCYWTGNTWTDVQHALLIKVLNTWSYTGFSKNHNGFIIYKPSEHCFSLFILQWSTQTWLGRTKSYILVTNCKFPSKTIRFCWYKNYSDSVEKHELLDYLHIKQRECGWSLMTITKFTNINPQSDMKERKIFSVLSRLIVPQFDFCLQSSGEL